MGTRGLLRRARPLLVSAIREMDTCSPRINSKLSLLLARLCQSKGNTMTKPLSPAAEAIFFAADGMQPRTLFSATHICPTVATPSHPLWPAQPFPSTVPSPRTVCHTCCVPKACPRAVIPLYNVLPSPYNLSGSSRPWSLLLLGPPGMLRPLLSLFKFSS